MSSSYQDLAVLKGSISLRADNIAEKPTTIHITQNPGWWGLDYTAKKDDGSVILTCGGKVWSKSARKQFKDSTGLPLYDLRMSWTSLSKAWKLELPGDGHQIMTVRLYMLTTKLELDCTFKNSSSQGGGEEEVMLKLRGQDVRHRVTHVFLGDQIVAVIRRVSEEGSKWGMGFYFKPDLEVDVAGNVDLGLIAVVTILEASVLQMFGDSTIRVPHGEPGNETRIIN